MSRIQDMLAAIGHAKHGNKIAQQHRKPGLSFASSLAGYITGTSRSQRMAFMKSMTKVELHAELSYAESLYAQVHYSFIALTKFAITRGKDIHGDLVHWRLALFHL
jgi:hypothetical protein